MTQELFNTIDALYPEFLGFWEDVCNIESPTLFKEGVDAVGNYFADFARAHGWSVERFPHHLVGDVVSVTMNRDAKKKPITLSGHMDTVHPLGSFGTPPVRVEGDRILGPGVLDCKGGIVAAALAMAALERIGFTERPVRLLLQSDEEGGSNMSNKATIGYMCERSADSAAFINLEGHTANKICVQRKGIITFTFKVYGKEAHSSLCATRGANAIAEAAHKIIELEKIKDDDGLTCNCGVISGGSVPNTVAGYCEFKANVRFATEEQLAFITEHVQKVAQTTHVEGCTCEVSRSGFRVAMYRREKNLDLADKINRIMEKAGLPTLEPMAAKGGSDAADVTVYGKVPCVDNMGTEGGFIHSPDEFAYLDSLRSSAKRLGAIALLFEED